MDWNRTELNWWNGIDSIGISYSQLDGDSFCKELNLIGLKYIWILCTEINLDAIYFKCKDWSSIGLNEKWIGLDFIGLNEIKGEKN